MSIKKADNIHAVAMIGMGSVGSGWSALMLAQGLKVYAYDQGEQSEAHAHAFIENAWPALQSLGFTAKASYSQNDLIFFDTIEDAARNADMALESVPEKLEIKHQIIAEIDKYLAPENIIASSTGGIRPSELQQVCTHPERFVVLHPFNPPHLMPLVEIVCGQKTEPRVAEEAMAFARRIGKYPIKLNNEITGHMTNRLQFALMREAVKCMVDGMASPADIDAAIRYGLAPRWILMGGILTLHLAGGPGGMKGILDHAGDAMEQWMTPSGDLRLDEKVRAKLVQASEEVAAGHEVQDWVNWRDEQLVAFLKLQQQSKKSEPGSE